MKIDKKTAKRSKPEAEKEPILEQMVGDVPTVDEELRLGPLGEVGGKDGGQIVGSEQNAPSAVEVLEKIKEEEKRKIARKTRSVERALREEMSRAEQSKMEITIKERRTLLKGWHKFIVASEKVERETIEQVGLFTTCSSRAKESILAPLKKFGEELRDRWEEMGGDKWIKSVMAVMISIDGWPDYASAIIFEFYSDSSKLETYFKVLYRDNADSKLSDVTASIPMCNGELFCSMQAFQNLSEYYRPLPDFNTLCSKSIDSSSGASNALLIKNSWIFGFCVAFLLHKFN
uniref:Uncharacterized protein n=1 Tax=Caenorhabditis japonica TaxID=281687 RepID=A0A8R1I5Q7_CAEJA